MESKVSVDGTSVLGSTLKQRLDFLRKTQNADGGWGYFPGKESWLEPTAYAALALHGDPAAERAWQLLSSWQHPDGSWRPSAKVDVSNWGTSLCVTLAAARGAWGDPAKRGVEWLVGTSGVESGWLGVWLAKLGITKPERDISLKAWPWKPGTSSWLEPTVHALIALKQAAVKYGSPELSERVRAGEAQLWNVRGTDGGWNYGSPAALGQGLGSYPETTALALVGLQGHPNLDGAFSLSEKMLVATPSPLGRAWLSIALRLHGAEAPEPTEALSPDIMITSIEALSAFDGNWKLLRAGNAS
jgi:hypothetical protein